MIPKESISKLEASQGLWGKILATTPIVMTVLATVFAGLSSSEMTQAMFHRSLASQLQSKAGDQWAYFQAKRLRGTTIEASTELLQTLGSALPFSSEKLIASLDKLINAVPKDVAYSPLPAQQEKLKQLFTQEEKQLRLLIAGSLPEPQRMSLGNQPELEQINSALSAIATKKNAEEISRSVKLLTRTQIESAIQAAEQLSDQFSDMCEPTSQFGGRLKKWIIETESTIQSLLDTPVRDNARVTAPMQQVRQLLMGGRITFNEFDTRRYRQEAQYNRKIAELYELQVWRSGLESDRHRHRSQLFFYSMLVAQVGVTISSLALAQAKRSALWFVAAFVGVIALGFSAWVYLSW